MITRYIFINKKKQYHLFKTLVYLIDRSCLMFQYGYKKRLTKKIPEQTNIFFVLNFAKKIRNIIFANHLKLVNDLTLTNLDAGRYSFIVVFNELYQIITNCLLSLFGFGLVLLCTYLLSSVFHPRVSQHH